MNMAAKATVQSVVAFKATKAAIDVAGKVRTGEELDIAAVDLWLKERVADLSGKPTVTQYSGGASNWTYRLAYPKHDLILRRPPAGTKARGAHDMGREYHIQKQLKPVFDKVPPMVAHCTDESVIGAEFYVMDRISGVIPRKRMPRDLPFNAEQARALCVSALDALVDLHSVNVESTGLSDLGKGEGYAERQIAGWSRRYSDARTWNVPRFKKVMAWLEANMPKDAGQALIHNDYRLDNLVLDADDPTRIIGILDWELATIGDPLMDLGNSLAYWIQADDDPFYRANSRQPTTLPGMLSRQQVVDHYFKRSGRDPVDMRFYVVYGLFRLAGIVQQIYYRYHHGQTDNPAFKRFWLMSIYLNWRCTRIIKTGRL